MAVKRTLLAICALLLVGTASAEGCYFQDGNFLAEGVLFDVGKDDREVLFGFKGSLSMRYASTPPNHPERSWNTIEIRDTSIRIRIVQVMTRDGPYDPHVFDIERGYNTILAFANSQQKVAMSIDNPVLEFSTAGELTRISGTYVALSPGTCGLTMRWSSP